MVCCLLLSLLIGKISELYNWCTDYHISHRLQKSLDAGMGPYIVQLDFSAAFDRVCHNGLLFKLKSIGVGDSVQSISAEFLFHHRQKMNNKKKLYCESSLKLNCIWTLMSSAYKVCTSIILLHNELCFLKEKKEHWFKS